MGAISEGGEIQLPVSHVDHILRAAYVKRSPFVYPPNGGRPAQRRETIHACEIHAGKLPRLEITDADIVGRLDLRFAKIDYPLRFVGCTFDSPVDLREAELRSVSFEACKVPAIDAGHVTVTGDVQLNSVEVAGRLSLAGAHLADDLHLNAATIGTDGGGVGDEPALDLANVEINGDLTAEKLIIHGKVKAAGARIQGRLPLNGAKITAKPDAAAWDGDGMHVGGDFRADGAEVTGMVTLIDAHVANADFDGAHLSGSDIALRLDRMHCEGSLFCRAGAQITGRISAMAVDIGACVYLLGSRVRSAAVAGNPVAGPDANHAVNLRRARVAADVRCDTSFQCEGEFDLTAAHIGGQVELRGADLKAGTTQKGPALIADRCEIGGDLHCDGDFAVHGTVSLKHTRVGGELRVGAAEREPDAAYAVVAPGLTVARDLVLHTAGTVSIRGAEVRGDIYLDLARLEGARNGAAADLSTIRARVLSLSGTHYQGYLDLTRAQVALLRDDPDSRPPNGPILLDGFEYGDIAVREADRLKYRRAWLTAGTTHRQAGGGDGVTKDGYRDVPFIPQPYSQLAAVCQRGGLDRDARNILCHLHRDHNRRAVSWRRFHSKLWNLLQDGFLGYGYAPVRALAWVIVLAGLGAVWLSVNHIGIVAGAILSLALLLPGSGLDQIEKWRADLSPWSHAIGALLVLCGLLLGATVLAALTRFIRR